MRQHTIGTHTGLRIEIGQAAALWVQLDGITSTRAIRRSLHTMFCGGINAWCATTTHQCEVLVHGNAYWAFHGTQVFEGLDLYVRGDRKLAGPFCPQAERVQLGWPQKP